MCNQKCINKLRKESFELIAEIYKAANSIPRERDQRKYRSQCDYIYNHQLKNETDYIKLEAALYDLNKIKRKLIAFWYYPGRPLAYEEALQMNEYIQMSYPKFKECD